MPSLRRMLLALFGRHDPGDGHQPKLHVEFFPREQDAPGGPRILVAYDELMIRRLIQINLERMGCQVATADNGREALKKIHQRRPDILVSDVLMPEMDGLELLANIRRDPAFADLPVIICMPLSSENPLFTKVQKEPTVYLSTPFHPTELVKCVRRFLPGGNAGSGIIDHI